MASKLLGSFSIREKGVGGLRQFDGGHKIKSRLQRSLSLLCFQDAILVTVTKSADFNPVLVDAFFENFFFFKN